ncbi:MAG: orotidine-5'-phosphate decarboxylase [Deltaproteobacteria bacterium]|nr:orotidine-5'-phosphate decarboxylase [Deltaproteobacteria bacterium]
MKARQRLVVALDTSDQSQALAWTRDLGPEVGWFKVGLELFTAAGPDLVRDIKNLGGRVFLDLKLHDIPATVRGALNAAQGLGAEMITVHIQAGPDWIRAVAPRERLKVVGVSLLTSLAPQDLEALGQRTNDPSALVLDRARLALEAGLSGVVCSGREAAAVRSVLGPEKLIICPGIRPAWSLVDGDDQARVTTPAQAVRAGADLIVVGRPILGAPDPVRAAQEVVQELAQAELP